MHVPSSRSAPLALLALGIVGACFGGSTKASSSDAGTGFDGGSSSSSGGDDGSVTGTSAGGTGAFGIVTVNGKQKMYLPASYDASSGHGIIAVVDVGVAGNGASGAPALITTIDLGSTNVATATGGDSKMVIAASTDNNNVWFIDPTTDTVTKNIQLDATYGVSSFSGGGGYVTGVAVDSANHRAILSVWNGFALVDLATQSITSVIQAPPSENFGFDSIHQRILAPFYDCSTSLANGMAPSSCNTPHAGDAGVMIAGLSIIDLTDSTVYTYEDPTQADPTLPVGNEPDSAAADPSEQIYVVPDEGSGTENVLDFSKANFDKATKTVTAPHVILTGFGLEGVAVEGTSHLGFWEGEGSGNVAVVDLTQARSGGQGWVGGVMPSEPGGVAFGTLGDPHGIAVTTSIINGSPVGFLVDNNLHWVVRVDLKQLQGLEQADASVTAGTTQMQGAVTYLDATTKE